MTVANGRTLGSALIDSLYADALLLADEARDWFDRARGGGGHAHGLHAHGQPTHGDVDQGAFDPLFAWAGRNDPSLRIALSCESLRLTTRLMHIISWLLLQRAVTSGEVDEAQARLPENRLGPAPEGDRLINMQLPDDAQVLIDRSVRLYERVAALEEGLRAVATEPAVLQLQQRLAASL